MLFVPCSVSQLFIGKAIDRLGNGVQAAPRDALIGDLSPAASRSACFGFAQSMRKCGSFIGAGLAFALMKASGNNYQAIFLLAAGVSLAATFAFALLVPSHPNASREQRQQAEEAAAAAAGGSSSSKDGKQQQQGDGVGQQAARLWQDVRQMGKDFYRTMGVIALYGMGHINESLLEARAIEVSLGWLWRDGSENVGWVFQIQGLEVLESAQASLWYTYLFRSAYLRLTSNSGHLLD